MSESSDVVMAEEQLPKSGFNPVGLGDTIFKQRYALMLHRLKTVLAKSGEVGFIKNFQRECSCLVEGFGMGLVVRKGSC